jgi:hypothetical protein
LLDFPASPTVGQQFTAAGVTWTWDGTKWTAAGLSGGYLPLTAGASFPLTGNLNLAYNAPAIYLNKNASGGVLNFIVGQTGGVSRWTMALGDSAAESGANAGSNFYISAASDTGVGLGTPLAINRASGLVTIPNLSAPQAIGDNRIVNGDMRIDQRNNGAAGTANGVYTVDRWGYTASQTGKGTWQRIGPAALGFPYGLGFTSSSAYASLATDIFGFSQPVEADMVSDFQWGGGSAQPVTLSFWVFSTLAGTFGGSVFNYPLPATRTYPFTYTLAANAWTKISLTIPGDTAGTWVQNGNAAALGVWFDLGSGVNYRAPPNAWAAGNYRAPTGTVSIVGTNGAALFLTGVKLEVGSVATPYNRQSLAKSLADCQRYYQANGSFTFGGYQVGGGVIYGSFPFPVTMRAAPTTAAFTGVSYTNGVNLALVSSYAGNINTQFGVSATGTGICTFGVTLSAEL